MPGDQLARQWRVIRAIEARPDGLTMAEIVACDGHREPYGKSLQKPVPEAGMGFFVLETEAGGFSDTFLKWTGLIGGNEVKAFNHVPSFHFLPWRSFS